MKKKKDVKSMTDTVKGKIKKCTRNLKRDLMKIEENFSKITVNHGKK